MPSIPREYFVCANSAQGFVNYFPSNLAQMQRIYILKGGPGTGKSTLMRTLGNHFLEKGEGVDYIHCSSDPDSLDGVILRDRYTAIVDGTAPHVIEPSLPGAVEEYINLGISWDSQILMACKPELLHLNHQIKTLYTQIYSLLDKAKKIHDRWESVYLENMDFSALNTVANDLIEKTFSAIPHRESTPTEVHRFLGALTPKGSVNYIEALTADCQTRYLLQGRPGTGKSTLLRKLADAALQKGLDTEFYHCSFDANSLDMVLIRPLRLCFFDSTSPHEIFPSRDSDILLDLYATAVRPGTDEENHETLALLRRSYDEAILGARTLLGEVRELHDALEGCYKKAVHFEKIDQITLDLRNTIERESVTPLWE